MFAFIVATPFHLLTVANIISTINYKSRIDIYIVDYSVRELAFQIKQTTSLINIVDCCERFARKEFANRYIRNPYLIYSKVRDKIMGAYIYKSNLTYNHLFVPYPSSPVLALMHSFKKNNKNIVVSMYEDGIGSYTHIGKYRHKSTQLLYKYLYGWDFYQEIGLVYLYKPELVKLDVLNKYKINKITNCNNNIVASYFHNAYSQEIKKYNNKKIIFFDQLLLSQSPNLIENEINIFKRLSSIVGKDEIICKLHPRVVGDLPLTEAEISKTKVPFEVLMNFLNIDNIVMVSYYSTACFSPKLILDKEPYIVFLFNLIEWAPCDISLLERIKAEYKKKDKIYAPKNIKELESIIIEIANKNDNR